MEEDIIPTLEETASRPRIQVKVEYEYDWSPSSPGAPRVPCLEK
jgi:hypothetical protein